MAFGLSLLLTLPLLDPLSQVGILFGNDPYAISRSPVLPSGPAAVAASTNADGSTNVTVATSATALFVTLTTEAAGRFSANARMASRESSVWPSSAVMFCSKR